MKSAIISKNANAGIDVQKISAQNVDLPGYDTWFIGNFDIIY